MSVYMKYRLERSGIKDLGRVCINHPAGGWIYRDISSEIKLLFPKSEILSTEAFEKKPCDLALIPYEKAESTVAEFHIRVKEVEPFSPAYVGFYDMKNRLLVIVKHSHLFAFYFRVVIFQVARFSYKLIKGNT